MKLHIKHLAAEKIRQYTKLCPNEISGLGQVDIIDGEPVVTDVGIFKQVVSSAHSTINPEHLAEFQDEIIKAGGSMKKYVLWWHSHAHMSVFFSGTDTGTIDSSTEFPYLVSLVVNKKGDAKARLDIYKPVRMMCELDVETEMIPDSDMTKALRAEMDAIRDDLEKEVNKDSEQIKDLCQKDIDEKVDMNKGWGNWNENRGSQGMKDPRDAARWESTWDKELRMEYWEDKNKMIRQINYLESKGGQGKKDRLENLKLELAEQIEYGVRMGYEKQDLLISGS